MFSAASQQLLSALLDDESDGDSDSSSDIHNKIDTDVDSNDLSDDDIDNLMDRNMMELEMNYDINKDMPLSDDDDSTVDYNNEDNSNISVSSESSVSTVGECIDKLIELETDMIINNEPIKYDTKNEIKINDLPHDKTTIRFYRFKKNHLKIVSLLLWEKFGDYFIDGTYERVILPNRNYIHFETGLLLSLFCLIFSILIFFYSFYSNPI
jgi:hypothetical protein